MIRFFIFLSLTFFVAISARNSSLEQEKFKKSVQTESKDIEGNITSNEVIEFDSFLIAELTFENVNFYIFDSKPKNAFYYNEMKEDGASFVPYSPPKIIG